MIGCMDGSGYLDDWMIRCVEGIDVIEAMKTLPAQPCAPTRGAGGYDYISMMEYFLLQEFIFLARIIFLQDSLFFFFLLLVN